MSDKSKLENYIERLDRALGPIPASDRAEIVLEIKSHIHESKSKHPDDSLARILAGLGEPESVANKYLMERGLKPGRPSKTPIVKWLTIGFLGTLSLFLIAVFVLLWKFSPLVSISGDEGEVSILGGMISISDKSGIKSTGPIELSENNSIEEKGSFIAPVTTERVKVMFTNTNTNISWQEGDHIEWTCRISGPERNADIVKVAGSNIELSLSETSQCTIKIPRRLSLYVGGANGKIALNKPVSDYEVDLTNGNVSIEPDPSVLYSYHLVTTHGAIDHFESTDASHAARSAKVSIFNGNIERI